MVWNQQETPVDTKSMVSEPYDSMWAKYKPKISKPKVGTYQMTIELLNSKKDYVDSNTSYFEIALKDDENSSAKMINKPKTMKVPTATSREHLFISI